MSQDQGTSPALAITEAITRLQDAFQNAGLKEPVALVLAGEEQVRNLEWHFAKMLMMTPNERPWETLKIHGMKVICNVPG